MPNVHVSAVDLALVNTIYSPTRARQPWILQDVLPEGATRYYSLARWALVDALRTYGVGPGDRVLVPGLICREVIASISLLGATAVFYPVSRDLCAELSADDLGQVKAVIAVNYFGFPQDLGVFRDYCQNTGAALIEDNAHGFLSRDEHGQLLGSRGDAGVFSLRKTIAVPDGGVLVLTGDRGMPKTLVSRKANAGSARYRLKQAFRRMAGRLGPRRTHRVISGTRQLRCVLAGDGHPAGAQDAEIRIPIGPSASSLFVHPLSVAEPSVEVHRRRALYELADRITGAIGAVSVFPCLPSNVVPYGFPMFVSQARLVETIAEVERYGFQISKWPELPTAVATEAPEHYRYLMVLPFLW